MEYDRLSACKVFLFGLNVSRPFLINSHRSSDVLTASVMCSRPAFAYWPIDEIRNRASLQEVLGFGPSDIERGFGRLHSIGITPQLAEALQAAYTYINIVKASLADNTHNVSLLADQRNLVQHHLLSVPPAAEVESCFSQPTHATTYEACRLAAQIFGVGVIFPIPAQSTPLHRLASQLQSVLRQPGPAALWSSPDTRIALIWGLTLGGIAAYDAPTRPYFAISLGETARLSNLTTWSDVKYILQMMLWYDEACDAAGEDLWLESAKSYTT